jgi:hypothetical protein
VRCPDCNQPVSDDAATCPACGHDLSEVVVGGDPSPAASTRRTRPSWLVFGGVAAAVLGVGAIAFGFFAGSPVGAPAFADRFPADTVAFVEIDVERLTSDDTRSLVEAFAPIVGSTTGEDLDVDALVNEAIASFDEQLGSIDLSYSEDIASWATGPVAFGYLGGSEDGEERAAAVVGGGDPDALDAFLAKLADNPAAGSTGSTTIAGVEFLVLDEEGVLVGRSGSDLIAASSEEVAAAIVEGDGPSLADDEGFAAQAGRLPGGPAMMFAVDGETLARDMEGMTGGADLGMGLGGFGSLGGMPEGWVAGALTLESDVVRVDVVGTVGEEMPAPTADEDLPGAFPAETIAFIRVGSVVDQLEGLLESGMFGPMTGDVEAETGIDPAAVLGLFSVDGALAVWPSSEPELPVNAALIGVSDTNQTDVVERLAQQVGTMGLAVEPTDSGYSIEGLVGLGTRDTYTILSTDPALVGAPPEESFADGELMARAAQLVSGDIQFAMDVPAVIDLVDGLVATEDPAAAEQLACLPLGVAAAGLEQDGDSIASSFAMEIVTPEGCGTDGG